jgi:hypothetical protein
MRWEYKVEEIPCEASDDLRKDLNDLGRQGWELIAVAATEGVQFAYFKRPIAPRAAE